MVHPCFCDVRESLFALKTTYEPQSEDLCTVNIFNPLCFFYWPFQDGASDVVRFCMCLVPGQKSFLDSCGIPFWAHLNRAYRIGRSPSSICLSSVCRPHSLNIFSSETTWPIEAKFHMKFPWDAGTKIYSNDPGHMTKMAVMPIYGKNLIWYAASGAQVLPSLFKWWPWVDFDLFYGKVKFGPLCFCMEFRKNNGFFRNYCRLWFETSNRWPKWQEVSVDIKTLSPGGCMPPALGLYTCIKSGKQYIISDFKEMSLKLATNG